MRSSGRGKWCHFKYHRLTSFFGYPRRSNERWKHGAPRSIIEELHSADIQQDQMEGDSDVPRSIVDELPSADIQGDEISGRSGGTGIIFHELHSSVIQRDQMYAESGVTRSIIDELHFSDI